MTLADAAQKNISYSDSKLLFPSLDPAQVETKKAAFQEFGLLYVIPRSNKIVLTPIGEHLFLLTKDIKDIDKNKRTILLLMCYALSNYQFNNPLPVGGNKQLARAQSSDVLPYLVFYYLLLKLDGVLTLNELMGIVFGLQKMEDIRGIENIILINRDKAAISPQLQSLPQNVRTADNLKIYFISHAGLDGEIIKSTSANYYGFEEQAFELTQIGYEIIESVLQEIWQEWDKNDSVIPKAKAFQNIPEYFQFGIGKNIPSNLVATDLLQSQLNTLNVTEGILGFSDIESLKELPHRNFKEGRKKLVQHARLETIRNAALVKEAKKYYKKLHGKLLCEICGFDFEAKYGKRGKDYIEAHHKTPISEVEEIVEITVKDLAMVCSNCHRMLHRPPWITVDMLKDVIGGK